VQSQRLTDDRRLVHALRTDSTAIDFLEREDVGVEAAAVLDERAMVDGPVAARTVTDVEGCDPQMGRRRWCDAGPLFSAAERQRGCA
jgi:hypothetical protein